MRFWIRIKATDKVKQYGVVGHQVSNYPNLEFIYGPLGATRTTIESGESMDISTFILPLYREIHVISS